MRCLISWNEDRSYYKVDVRQLCHNVVHGRVECLDIFGHYFAKVSQAGKIYVSDHDFSSHTGCNLGGISSNNTSSQHKYPCRAYSCNSSHEFTFSALWLFEEVCTDLCGHTSGHFTHRSKQRQRTVFFFDCFVCNAHSTTFYHGFSQHFVGGKVEVGKYNLPFFDEFILRFDRLFNLDNHIGNGIYLVNRRKNLGTYGLIDVIGEAAICTSIGLYIHCMPFLHQFGNSCRGHSYTVLIVFNFFGYSDNHNLEVLNVRLNMAKDTDNSDILLFV